MAREYPPVPREQRARISAKIRKLRHEGKPQAQAVAMAHEMSRAGRLTKRGGYRRVGRRSSRRGSR